MAVRLSFSSFEDIYICVCVCVRCVKNDSSSRTVQGPYMNMHVPYL